MKERVKPLPDFQITAPTLHGGRAVSSLPSPSSLLSFNFFVRPHKICYIHFQYFYDGSKHAAYFERHNPHLDRAVSNFIH